MGGKEIKGNSIILATGSSPSFPKPFLKSERVITHVEALEFSSLPERMLIVGGGVNGCEFAYLFSSFGVKVEIVEIMERLLPFEDREVSFWITRSLEERGVKVRTGASLTEYEEGKSGIKCKFSHGQIWEGDIILLCAGRKRNSKIRGLEEVGVLPKKGVILTDERMRTEVENIYAAGDITSSPQLAHVAFKEGIVAAENIAGLDTTIDYRAVPRVIFTHPEAASVGLTEEEAKKEFGKVKVARFPFTASGKAVAEGEEEGWVKIIASPETGEILGLHILSPHAGELIGEGVLAINLEATVEDMARSMHPHPTRSEALMEASSLLLGEAIHFLS